MVKIRTGFVYTSRLFLLLFLLMSGLSPTNSAAGTVGSRAVRGGARASRTFTGQVVYQPRNGAVSPAGVSGVQVSLIGSDPGGDEAVVTTTVTGRGGSFSLTGDDDWTHHRLELGSPPRGHLAREASGGAQATAVDARTIDYGTASPGTYADNIFVLGDVLLFFTVPTGPYFLIVAPQSVIDAGALDEFAAFKRRLGFVVETISVETIDATFTGSNRQDRIRALEQARRAAYGSRFQYVMLIGPHSVIPFALITPGFAGKDGDGNVDLTACGAPPNGSSKNQKGVRLKFSDWYYADLVSDFDSNGNGCLLDGITAKGDDHRFGHLVK